MMLQFPARTSSTIRREVAEEYELRGHDIGFLVPRLLPKTISRKVERSGYKLKYMDGVLHQGVPRRRATHFLREMACVQQM